MQKEDIIIEQLKNIRKLLKNQVEKPLNFLEACLYLDISKSYLYKLTHKYLIPHYKPQGKKIYFNKQELDKWIFRNGIRVNTKGGLVKPIEYEYFAKIGSLGYVILTDSEDSSILQEDTIEDSILKVLVIPGTPKENIMMGLRRILDYVIHD